MPIFISFKYVAAVAMASCWFAGAGRTSGDALLLLLDRTKFGVSTTAKL